MITLKDWYLSQKHNTEIPDNLPPATGNIYREVFWHEGERYVGYTIDCAGDCDKGEMALETGRGHTAINDARRNGWTKGEHGKWLCPDCSRKELAKP